MAFLIESTVRRVAPAARAALVRAGQPGAVVAVAPRRLFSTPVPLRKSAVDTAKEGLKKVDRTLGDKIVDGINIGATIGTKAKEAVRDIATGKASGQAAQLRDEAASKAKQAKGSAEETAGEAKGRAGEMADQATDKVQEATGKAQEVAGEAKGKVQEVAGKAKGKGHEATGEAKGKAQEAADAAKGKTQEAAGEAKSKM